MIISSFYKTWNNFFLVCNAITYFNFAVQFLKNKPPQIRSLSSTMRCKFAVTQECGAQFRDIHPTSVANLRIVHRRSASNREGRSWNRLFSTWGRPIRRLSWTASLPSQKALTYCAASQHASRILWKHSCVLRHRATWIFIHEHCSSFVNMVLGHSHCPYESQRFTLK